HALVGRLDLLLFHEHSQVVEHALVGVLRRRIHLDLPVAVGGVRQIEALVASEADRGLHRAEDHVVGLLPRYPPKGRDLPHGLLAEGLEAEADAIGCQELNLPVRVRRLIRSRGASEAPSESSSLRKRLEVLPAERARVAIDGQLVNDDRIDVTALPKRLVEYLNSVMVDNVDISLLSKEAE